MRRFPFGALSSLEGLAYGWMTGPCAEREAPHANSLLSLTILCQMVFLLNSKS